MYIKSLNTWIFISYVVLVLYFSAPPGNNISWFFQLWKYDKIVHFMEYLGMGFLLINALKIKPLKKSEWKFAILFLLVFPVIDELLQHFTPTRIPDVLDGVADVLGGLTGAYLRKYL
jgi:hypothetical protein